LKYKTYDELISLVGAQYIKKEGMGDMGKVLTHN
tara:strand:- start:69 stop:170 length:102 start_codon:yes stop_codon:yes gene_type:complete